MFNYVICDVLTCQVVANDATNQTALGTFDWSSIITDTNIQIILTIIAVIGVWLAWRQLRLQNKISSADFLHRFNVDFFSDECRDLIMLLNNEALLFNEENDCFDIVETALENIKMPEKRRIELKNRKIFTMYEADDYLLGPLEQVYYFYKHGLLDISLIYESFGWYIDVVCDNKAIKNYVISCRKDNIDIYDGIESLKKLCEEFETKKNSK